MNIFQDIQTKVFNKISIFFSYAQTLTVGELEEEMNEEIKDKKYKYEVNKNLSYGFLKNRILHLLINEEKIREMALNMFQDTSRNL